MELEGVVGVYARVIYNVIPHHETSPTPIEADYSGPLKFDKIFINLH
jgi:hypothetical protein